MQLQVHIVFRLESGLGSVWILIGQLAVHLQEVVFAYVDGSKTYLLHRRFHR